LEIATLKYGQVLFRDGEPADMAYFPLTAVISMIALMRNGDEMEYGSIGREGMVGLQVALNSQPLRGRAICQLEGEAVVIARDDMTQMSSEALPELHRLLMRYAQSTINVLAQSTACNALHPLRQRMARWLLMTRDRVGRDSFALTQEFLAMMIGVRRTGVNEAALQYRKDNIIRYTRGNVTVMNLPGLQKASCECYEFMRDEYARVVE
jgi:CRP-like cAMP-binding protein